jgi:N-acetylglucosaminyl-diphospho-decaprenol L-rhamnosyltransferase
MTGISNPPTDAAARMVTDRSGVPHRVPIRASIQIVSHNTREMTLACLRSILHGAHSRDVEVIVVDNASDDGSPEAIEREFPEVRLISSPENLGFAGANNIAANQGSGIFLLLLNPDTLVYDQAIERLLKFADQQPQAGIWGGRTTFADGSLNPRSCWRFASLWSMFCQAVGLSAVFPTSRWFNSEAYGGWMRDSVREVDFVTGCFLLIKRELWQQLGGFDERFFMYAEEADLCYRARRLGARPLFTPEAAIVHYGGASEPARAAKIEKLFAGKSAFMRKHWPVPKRMCGVFLLTLHVVTRVAGYTALTRLTGSEEHMTCVREWREVWRVRGRWAQGYGERNSHVNARGSTRGSIARVGRRSGQRACDPPDTGEF